MQVSLFDAWRCDAELVVAHDCVVSIVGSNMCFAVQAAGSAVCYDSSCGPWRICCQMHR